MSQFVEIDMSYSAKILDDSVGSPFVVGLVQIHSQPIRVLAETSSSNKLSVQRVDVAVGSV